MAGFGMDKGGSQERGGFGMNKTLKGSDTNSGDQELESLPDYLEMEKEDESYVFNYLGEEGPEEVLTVNLEEDLEASIEGDFSGSDYELFIEDAGRVLEELGELENSYTLLERVEDYG